MIIVIDNALSTEEQQAVKTFFVDNKNFNSTVWVDGTYKDFFNYGSPLSKILNCANKFIDLSSMVGCEYWSHYYTKPDWHIDKDENLFERTKEIKTPICSIVYYAYVNNLQGGNFLTEDIKIKPIENRLLIFSPHIYHSVENYEGNRLSVAINTWSYKIE